MIISKRNIMKILAKSRLQQQKKKEKLEAKKISSSQYMAIVRKNMIKYADVLKKLENI